MKLHLRIIGLCLTMMALGGIARAQLTGIKTIPSTAYPTLAVAIDSLNLYGVGSGGVVINLTANETAPTGGYKLGSTTLNASTSSGNAVTINGGGKVITPYTGTGSADGIFYIMGTDYVSIKSLNLIETSANTTTTTQMEWGYSLVKLSSSAPYDGCQNVLIDGCTITLNGTNSSTIGIRAAHAVAGSTSTLSTSSATVASTNSYNNFTRNTITEVARGISLIGISSGATVYDKDNRIGGTAAGSGNNIVLGSANGTLTLYGTYTQYDSVISIRNNAISLATGTTSSSTRYMIYMSTGFGDLNVTDNYLDLTCNMTGGSIYAYYNYGTSSGHGDPTSTPQNMLSSHNITGNTITGSNANTGIVTVYGIFEYYTYCKLMNISNNNMKNMTWAAGSIYGYYTGYSGVPYITVEDNKFTGINNTYSSGQTMGFYMYHYNSPFGVFSLKRNIVRSIKANYFIYPYYIFASYTAAPTGYTAQKYLCYSNVADSLDVSAATTGYIYDYRAYYGMDSSEIKYNRLTNVTGSATGTTYVYFQTYGYYATKSYKVIGNTIDNIKGFNLYNNFYIGFYSTNCDSNTVSNISQTGSSGYTYNYMGYYGSNASVSYNKMVNWNLPGSHYFYNFLGYYCSGSDVHHNRIDSLSWGSGNSYPFYTYANGAPDNVYNNIVSNLSWTSTSLNVYPYYLLSSSLTTPVNFYNNFLTNVLFPSGYASTNSIGVYCASTATYNLFHNTIYINNPSFSPGSGFGYTGIYYPSSAILDLRNNIINVNVAPSGTGFTAALRRSTGTTGTSPTNFLGTSNGNIYYTPSATNSWYYCEGTSSGGMANPYNLTIDPAFNTPCGAFKSFMGHDQASFSENKMVAGTIPNTYLPTGTSYAEKGAVPTSNPTVITDYANVTRGAVADIGALEFSGTALDNAPPIISYTPLDTLSYCSTCPTLVATITDNSGVNNTPGTAPRLYYKKSAENNAFSSTNNTSTFNGWKWVEATSVSGSSYTFNFDCSLLTSALSPGDAVSYFVIAQDNASPINAGASVASFNVCPTTVALSSTNAPVKSSPVPNGFKILSTPTFAISAFPNSSCGAGSSAMTVTPTPVGAAVQWQSATLTGSFSNITGATNVNYTTPVNTTTLRYRALILCGTSTLTTTAIDTFVIANPSIISVKGDTLCGYQTHTLTANPAPFTTPYWYTAATGGLAFTTGNSFTTNPLNSTTTYYVSANTPNASTEILDCPAPVQGYSYGATTTVGLELTFRNPSTHFYSTTIYPYNATAGSKFDIELWDAASMGPVSAANGGPYTYTVTVAFTGNGTTPQVVNLPFRNIKPGKYLLMYTNPVGSPWINFQYIGSTPMPVSTPSGNVTATNGIYYGSYYNYYWMYFYHNIFGADCESPTRTPVTAMVTPAPAIVAASPGVPGICAGSTTTIGVTSPNTSYVYTWTPGPLTGATQTVSPTTSTTYHVIAADPYTGCKNHDSIILNVNPKPAPPVITPTNPIICGGTYALLNAAAPLGVAYNAQVGTGTSTYGGSYSLWFPFGGYYMGQHTQYLILASELNAAGIRKGGITSVAFDQVTPPGATIASYLVRMAPTTTTSLSGSFISTGFTTVANLTSLTLSGGGWKNIPFSSTFMWDGVSNVILDIAQNNCASCPTSTCGAVYGQSGDVHYTSTGFNSVLYGYSYGGCDVASFAPTQNWYGTYGTNARPNMQFNWRAPADVNWLNITGLYKNAAMTSSMSLTDTNSNAYASPATTTVYTAITNFQGCLSVPSLPDTVNVIPAPVVTITPAGPQTICAGQPVTLCIPTGVNQTYQWYLNNTAISGANSNCYVAGTAGSYTVKATNVVTGCTATSIPTVLTVNAVPTISITATGSTTICKGSSVPLQANSGTAVGWQWALNGVNVPGATTSTLNATDSGKYTVTVMNTFGCSNTSAVLVVKVNVVPDTVMPQSSTSFCTGDSVDLQAMTGATLSYQWYNGSGALTNDTNSLYRARTTGNYYVVVTDRSTGCTATSRPVAVSAGAGPNAAISPNGPLGGCQGGTVTLYAVKQPGLCYQWYQNSVPLSGANSDNLVVNSAGNYTVEVTICNTNCKSTTLTPTVVNLNPLPNASVTPSSVSSFCQGDSVMLNANAGSGLSYQWSLNKAAIPGATNSQLKVKNGGDYQVTVTNNSTGCFDTSKTITIAVKAAPSTTITPASNPTFCAGGSVVLNAGATGSTSYQWYKNGVAEAGQTSSSYTATATGLYSVMVTGSNSCVATSATTSVQVNALPTVTTVPTGNAAVCQGYTTVLTVPSGPGLTYQWYNGTTAISGATSNTYTTGTAGSYNVKVTNSVTGCFANSGNIALTVNTPPSANASTTANTTICQDDSVKLSANTGTGLTYQWKLNGIDITGPSGTGSDFYAKASGRYTVAVSSATNCTTLSNSIQITVNPRPAAYITYNTPLEFCEGSAVVLTANTGTGLTYQWYQDGVPLSNTTGINVSATSGKYTLKVTNTFLCSSTADTLDVTVWPTPVPSIVRTGSTLSTSQPYSSYQWFFNNNAIGMATSATYSVTQNGAYKVRVIDDNGCEGYSTQFFISNVGIAQTNAGRSIKVYPNPATAIVHIDASVKIQVVLRDVTGRSVLEAKDVKEIDLGDVATGTYLLYISDLEGQLLRVEKLTRSDR